MRSPLRLLALALALALGLAATPAALSQVVPAPTGAAWDLAPALAPASTAAPLAGELERFLVALDADVFTSGQAQPGDAVALTLPDGPRAFTVTRVDRHRPGTVSLTAVASDGSGEVAALTYGPSGVLGAISAGDDVYHLFPAEGGTALARMDPAGMDVLACGVDGHDHTPAPAGEAGRAAMTHAPSMPALAEGTDDPVTIDLLIPYTANAAAWASENALTINQVIAQALALSQLALDNSGTGITLRVVHAYETDYDDTITPPTGEAGQPSAWHLYRLTASAGFNAWGDAAAGFMEEVPALRSAYGADLVAMIARVNDVGGIAWLLNSIAGRPELGFSVNRVQQIASPNNFTLVHEIGHNLGNVHGRDQPTAEAPARGGLFAYSAGWRWVGEDGSGYHTVMSYGQPGDLRVPHFSNPDIIYLGGPTGTSSTTAPFGPADAARSMRESKRIVAAYQPTRVDPPVAAVEPPAPLELRRDEVVARTLIVSNSGATDLVWELDLVPTTPATAAFAARVTPEGEVALTLETPAPPEGGGREAPSVVEVPGNLSPGALLTEGDITLIYSTFFSAQQGFAVGDHLQRELWTSRTGLPFLISTANPNRGNRHLRLTGSTATLSVYSPYFGAWPTGRYELSMDISISERHESAHFVPLLDGRSGATLGGFAFAGSGAVLAFNPAQGNYTGIERTWEEGVYQRYTVVIDPDAARVRYRIGAEEVASRPLPTGAGGIGHFYFARNPGAGADHFDVDDISYQSLYLGLEWARPDRLSGVTPPGGETPVTITFPAEDVGPGAYRAEAVLRSNDPAAPRLGVPVALDVSTLVNAEAGATAERTRLLGNRPNPFSDATRIAYALAAPVHVTLEVFTVTGQRVAVLADAYQPAGEHEVAFETAGLASGLYVYRLRAGGVVEAGRMLLVR